MRRVRKSTWRHSGISRPLLHLHLQKLEEARFDEDEKWIVFYDAQYAAEKAAWDLLRQTGSLVAALQ